MSPAEMLEVLDDAIADAPRWRPNAVALELVGARNVLGERGRPVYSEDTEHPLYAFTAAQCKRMRLEIRAAARADAAGMPS